MNTKGTNPGPRPSVYQWPPGMRMYAWEGGGTRLGVDDAIFVKFKFVACSIAFACVSLAVP